MKPIAIVVVVAAMLASACSGSDEDEPDRPPPPTSRWERTERWEHRDVVAYDNVAAAASPRMVSWVTRRPSHETSQLTYWTIQDGEDAVPIDLPAPFAQVAIPVGVGADDAGWVAVAVTRDVARGPNAGLVAWHGNAVPSDPPNPSPGGDREASPAAPLVFPRGRSGEPESVTAAALSDRQAIVALIGGDPVVWTRAGDTAEGANRAWSGRSPELGVEEQLVNLKVAAVGDRLLLAAADTSGQAHLWTSDNGEDWEPLEAPELPDNAGSVDLLTRVGDDEVAIGWLADEDSAPMNASSAVIQRLHHVGGRGRASEAVKVTDEGTIDADDTPTADRIDLAGASVSPDDRLVVAGASLQSNGTEAPMMWVRHEGEWASTEQSELTGRFDYAFRSIMTTHDGEMIGLMVGLPHIDVEAWRWSAR